MHADGVHVCGLKSSPWPFFVLTVAQESCPLACEKGVFPSFAHCLEGPRED